MNNHRHSLHFVFGEDLVRCVNGFECDFSRKASVELENSLPGGARVEFDDSELKFYKVTVGGSYWCTITDYQSGHLYVRDFEGSNEDLEVFQAAIEKALGIYNRVIIENIDSADMSSVAP